MAASYDCVKWNEIPEMVVVKKERNVSLGLSITTRQVSDCYFHDLWDCFCDVVRIHVCRRPCTNCIPLVFCMYSMVKYVVVEPVYSDWSLVRLDMTAP